MVSYHPAGRDTALYPAVQEVKAGHWMAMRQVLAETGTWPQWTARTQVLSVFAARGNTVELWLKEEPESIAAQMMYARVLTERALEAYRSRRHARDAGRSRHLDELASRARQACDRAAEVNPADPVAVVCRLALAETDPDGRFPEHRAAPPPPEFLLPPGPWGLLQAAHQRDAYNREAWHRMLRVLQVGPGAAHLSRQGVAMDFARWSASKAPLGSPLLLLPLYAYMEGYRARRDQGKATLSPEWADGLLAPAITRAFTDWFSRCTTVTSSPTDLNYLAHALVAGGFRGEAAAVFKAIGDFATPAPWQYVAQHPHRWREDFETTRSACLRARNRPAGGKGP
ncbi:hypothetical protein [Streptomyces sp. MST-110588]|uniref:hypothetical protein n=1 Tax=Streptomyces sp. MST-110588 TaxID=2833628 RepID=UPI002062DF73|nr:hypothetical protein [Streptomyces sp. MST-110588]UNO38357.1 hypothetical protein KGS77_00165 [Streptomyces sp. MST-110588]